MTLIDIIILVVFAVATLMGYRKGLVAQAGTVAAIIIAVLACRVLGPSVTEMIIAHRAYESEPSLWQRFTASALAYCGVYIIAYYVVVLIVRLLRFVVSSLKLGPLDRIAGVIVSLFKWFMALSVAANLYLALFPSGQWLSTTKLCGDTTVYFIVSLAPKVLGVITNTGGSVPQCDNINLSTDDESR